MWKRSQTVLVLILGAVAAPSPAAPAPMKAAAPTTPATAAPPPTPTSTRAAPATPAAATACDVTWTPNAWSTGFTADVKLTNNAAPITSWTLTWTFTGAEHITSAWNATVTQSGTAVTARNLAWNGTLATGAATSFGVQATGTTTTAPSDFAVNGVSCRAPIPSDPPPTGSGSDGGFEDQTTAVPSGDWSVSTPDCSGNGTATIDKTVAHTGTTSLRITGAAGYCNHVFAANTRIIDPAATAWYVRYWVRHTTALPAAHVTTVALRDTADANKDLRFGGQNGALQFNRASDDATLPEQSPAGVALSRPLPIGTWTCVEFTVNANDGTMETWLDGVSVPGLRQDGVPTHDIDSQWLSRTYRPRLADLRLGWESYGDGADTLWYDDVQVAGSRIGC